MTLQNDPCNVRVSRSLEKITADCEMLRRNDLAITGQYDDGSAWHYRPYTAGDGYYCISVWDQNEVLLGYL